jgi:ActR/RegA family two-component response regulator
VRAALHETLPAGDSSITAVTRQLAVSSRTLQRQLREEGTPGVPAPFHPE